MTTLFPVVERRHGGEFKDLCSFVFLCLNNMIEMMHGKKSLFLVCVSRGRVYHGGGEALAQPYLMGMAEVIKPAQLFDKDPAKPNNGHHAPFGFHFHLLNT